MAAGIDGKKRADDGEQIGSSGNEQITVEGCELSGVSVMVCGYFGSFSVAKVVDWRCLTARIWLAVFGLSDGGGY